MDAPQTAEVLIARLLPLGYQVSVGIALVEAVLVQLWKWAGQEVGQGTGTQWNTQSVLCRVILYEAHLGVNITSLVPRPSCLGTRLAYGVLAMGVACYENKGKVGHVGVQEDSSWQSCQMWTTLLLLLCVEWDKTSPPYKVNRQLTPTCTSYGGVDHYSVLLMYYIVLQDGRAGGMMSGVCWTFIDSFAYQFSLQWAVLSSDHVIQ